MSTGSALRSGRVPEASRARVGAWATGAILSAFAVTTVAPAPASRAKAPAPAAVRESVRAWRLAHDRAILRELMELLSIPNVASDASNIRRNAEAIVKMLEQRGVRARLLESGGPPAVYGDLPAPGARRTLVFYAHYDGQPVDPARWSSDPWVPVLRDKSVEAGGRVVRLEDVQGPLDGELRIYARSASDDKAPVVALLAALDALRDAKLPLSVNVKIFLEGEEEAGSPHLEETLRRHKELLAGDGWLLCDGPVHQTRRLQLFFGARGTTDLEVNVYGPLRPLHSGHYGNWAPNPAVLLAHLVASLRDAEGRIRVAGFYDDVRPLTETERRAAAEVPDVDGELRRDLGLAATEAGGARLAERILLPALNLRGIEAGRVGQAAANVIPTEARASIDFRLVPDQTPGRVRERVEAHLATEGWLVVHDAPDVETRRRHARVVRLEWGAGYPAARTSMDLPLSRAIARVAEEAVGGPVVKAPTLGGSVPMHLFQEILGTPIVGVPIANHDNNQHGADENLRLQNLWDGIEVYAALLARLGGALDQPAASRERRR